MSIKKAAQRLAKEDGVSLNQWIAVAVAEKVGVAETAAEFFRRRAGKATGEGLMEFLVGRPRPDPKKKIVFEPKRANYGLYRDTRAAGGCLRSVILDICYTNRPN
jgi:hypothetical protein